jgi:hypothetical protein
MARLLVLTIVSRKRETHYCRCRPASASVSKDEVDDTGNVEAKLDGFSCMEKRK